MTKYNPSPCPACGGAMPAPPRRGHNVYVHCPSCPARPRAKFYDRADGAVDVIYLLRRDSHETKVKRVGKDFAALMDTAEFRGLVLDKYGIVI